MFNIKKQKPSLISILLLGIYILAIPNSTLLSMDPSRINWETESKLEKKDDSKEYSEPDSESDNELNNLPTNFTIYYNQKEITLSPEEFLKKSEHEIIDYIVKSGKVIAPSLECNTKQFSLFGVVDARDTMFLYKRQKFDNVDKKSCNTFFIVSNFLGDYFEEIINEHRDGIFIEENYTKPFFNNVLCYHNKKVMPLLWHLIYAYNGEIIIGNFLGKLRYFTESTLDETWRNDSHNNDNIKIMMGLIDMKTVLKKLFRTRKKKYRYRYDIDGDGDGDIQKNLVKALCQELILRNIDNDDVTFDVMHSKDYPKYLENAYSKLREVPQKKSEAEALSNIGEKKKIKIRFLQKESSVNMLEAPEYLKIEEIKEEKKMEASGYLEIKEVYELLEEKKEEKYELLDLEEEKKEEKSTGMVDYYKKKGASSFLSGIKLRDLVLMKKNLNLSKLEQEKGPKAVLNEIKEGDELCLIPKDHLKSYLLSWNKSSYLIPVSTMLFLSLCIISLFSSDQAQEKTPSSHDLLGAKDDIIISVNTSSE